MHNLEEKQSLETGGIVDTPKNRMTSNNVEGVRNDGCPLLQPCRNSEHKQGREREKGGGGSASGVAGIFV